MIQHLDQYRPDLRGWEYDYLQNNLSRPTTKPRHTQSVHFVVWSPGGKRFASASSDAIIKIWDTVRRSVLYTLQGHTQHGSSLAWSPDGKRIASSSEDATIKIWDGAYPISNNFNKGP